MSRKNELDRLSDVKEEIEEAIMLVEEAAELLGQLQSEWEDFKIIAEDWGFDL